ncbi:TPA: transposase [Klebsiella pneumoniae]|nr:transposase [Klebsiella pneumoniae]
MVSQNRFGKWCREYNHERMHSSLNDITPAEFGPESGLNSSP